MNADGSTSKKSKWKTVKSEKRVLDVRIKQTDDVSDDAQCTIKETGGSFYP